MNIPFYGRIVRATVLAVKQTEYVEAARALGLSELRLSLSHVLRNCLAPIVVAVTLNVGGMITALAGLSFLGLGVQPPTSDWGSMLSSSRQYMNVAPHVAALPGLAIFLAVLGLQPAGRRTPRCARSAPPLECGRDERRRSGPRGSGDAASRWCASATAAAWTPTSSRAYVPRSKGSCRPPAPSARCA